MVVVSGRGRGKEVGRLANTKMSGRKKRRRGWVDGVGRGPSSESDSEGESSMGGPCA